MVIGVAPCHEFYLSTYTPRLGLVPIAVIAVLVFPGGADGARARGGVGGGTPDTHEQDDSDQQHVLSYIRGFVLYGKYYDVKSRWERGRKRV